ncbi:hypothetical protein N7453_000349 [Penicillium expansum]|nr:hypothetical protein N7453_000349 [Penicillium expansum]
MSFPELRLAPHLGRWGMFCFGIRYQVQVYSALFTLKYIRVTSTSSALLSSSAHFLSSSFTIPFFFNLQTKNFLR